jgi:hypothetical protein
MSGPGEPPEGTPESTPGGSEEEYRSVVFDESFVRAARIQEFSARERLDGATRAVRIRHVIPRGLARQAVALILLIVVAFGFAVYMGVRHPYKSHNQVASEQLRVTTLSLVPPGVVPAVSADAPFDGGQAALYKAGADGLVLPKAHRVGGFAKNEVSEAFDTAKEYLTDSAIDLKAVTGGDVGKIRDLLNPGQLDEFESSLISPVADGTHETTGWIVRFNPTAIQVVKHGIRVEGSLAASQTSSNELEIAADHTFVYALRGTGDGEGAVSLFTVRRQLRFEFNHEDLRQHHIQLVQANIAAGPLACNSDVTSFHPILAGKSAPGGVAGIDPYDHVNPVGTGCAVLTDAATTPAQSSPAQSSPAQSSPAQAKPKG